MKTDMMKIYSIRLIRKNQMRIMFVSFQYGLTVFFLLVVTNWIKDLGSHAFLFTITMDNLEICTKS